MIVLFRHACRPDNAILIYFNTDVLPLYYQTFNIPWKNTTSYYLSAWMKKALLFWIIPFIIMIKKTQKCLFIAFSHSVFSPVHLSSVVFWLRETAVIPNHQIHIYCYIYYYYYTVQKLFLFFPRRPKWQICCLLRWEKCRVFVLHNDLRIISHWIKNW